MAPLLSGRFVVVFSSGSQKDYGKETRLRWLCFFWGESKCSRGSLARNGSTVPSPQTLCGVAYPSRMCTPPPDTWAVFLQKSRICGSPSASLLTNQTLHHEKHTHSLFCVLPSRLSEFQPGDSNSQKFGDIKQSCLPQLCPQTKYSDAQ